MGDYLSFCEKYSMEPKNARSLAIFTNFNKFMAHIKSEREKIQNATILECYKINA